MAKILDACVPERSKNCKFGYIFMFSLSTYGDNVLQVLSTIYCNPFKKSSPLTILVRSQAMISKLVNVSRISVVLLGILKGLVTFIHAVRSK